MYFLIKYFNNPKNCQRCYVEGIILDEKSSSRTNENSIVVNYCEFSQCFANKLANKDTLQGR